MPAVLLPLLLLLLALPLAARTEPRLLLDPSVCEASADYTPGRDVRGRAVAPADLEQDADMGARLAETLSITLQLDLAQRFGLPLRGLKPDVQLGTLLRTPTGELLLNGKPLKTSSEADVEALCQQAMNAAKALDEPAQTR